MAITDVAHVTRVSSNESYQCEHCDFRIGQDVPASINHYIEVHGYKLLHVGTETMGDGNGGPFHATIAVLGSDNPPPIAPPVEFFVKFLDENGTENTLP